MEKNKDWSQSTSQTVADSFILQDDGLFAICVWCYRRNNSAGHKCQLVRMVMQSEREIQIHVCDLNMQVNYILHFSRSYTVKPV